MCIRDSVGRGGRIQCVYNPTVGREGKWCAGSLIRVAKAKKALVIGGGPAGLEYARVAAARGPEVTVLALGGASWPRLGSDAAWVPWLEASGVTVAPFRPANLGFSVAWSDHMARHFGTPVKGAALVVAGQRERGEFVVSARGIEGGGVYAVSRAVREGAALTLDLAPDRTLAEVAGRLAKGPGKDTVQNWLRKALKLVRRHPFGSEPRHEWLEVPTSFHHNRKRRVVELQQ